ncbi:hypothetical protein SAMN04487765_3691 [Tenacibaculum sp. MAR_2010_89]|uniref:hypothetical protein n=1 Tax=Tenacibaculum sp. MAR_2010_89 TaxID=1250198 RepID=UPI000897F611|nr:hypothetical protein [Tenacibaculum sp. MAR_2010_89]SEE66637.1 hypothetical protein SAMN04487765_3691 [Tenacibaculum sp. MAR_2010_89]
MKIFRTIVAFLQALLLFLGFSFLSAVIYSELNSPYNIIIAIAVFSVGVFLSRSLFNLIIKRGVLSVISGDNATYDLDELEPTLGSDVLKLTPEELTNLFSKNKPSFNKGVTVSIWGDWQGRQLDTRHQLDSLNFNSDNDILTINFSDKCILKVKSPRIIFYTSSYLKVVKAKEILWEVPVDTNSKNQYSYLNTAEKIYIKSNTKWKPHAYDIGIGMNALYLQG